MSKEKSCLILDADHDSLTTNSWDFVSYWIDDNCMKENGNSDKNLNM